MLTIIGCGNPNRCDDGVGVETVQAIQKYLGENPKDEVTVFDAGTGGMEVMFKARGCSSLIIVDANQSDSEAGTIFKVPGEELQNIPEPSYNLHDFRWDHALFVGKKLYKDEFPTDVTVYLIEAESLDLGIGLSQPVDSAKERVVQKIIDQIESMES